jgi:hypothetical protein
MKFGFRKPSFKKSFAARTSWKRAVRHNLGLKAPRGWGWLTNPKKAAYNRVYNRTTFGLGDVFGGSRKRSTSRGSPNQELTGTSDAGGCAVVVLALVLFGAIAAASSLAVAVGVTVAVSVAVGAVAMHLRSERRAFARMAAEADTARAEAQAQQAEEARQARWNDLCGRFGPRMAEAILQGRFWKGATFEMIYESLGAAAHSTERVLKTKTKTTLYFRPITAKRYALKIYFEHGRVVGWDDGNERVRSE